MLKLKYKLAKKRQGWVHKPFSIPLTSQNIHRLLAIAKEHVYVFYADIIEYELIINNTRLFISEKSFLQKMKRYTQKFENPKTRISVSKYHKKRPYNVLFVWKSRTANSVKHIEFLKYLIRITKKTH